MEYDTGFNTIQYDIDLKHTLVSRASSACFNTIQYDIDLKQNFKCI